MVSYIPIWFIKVWTEKRRTRRAMATNFAEVLMITFWFTVSITAIDSYNVTATWLYHSVTTTATWLFHGDYDHSFLSLPQCPWPQLPDSTTVPITTATRLFHSEYDHSYLTLPQWIWPLLPDSTRVPITTATLLFHSANYHSYLTVPVSSNIWGLLGRTITLREMRSVLEPRNHQHNRKIDKTDKKLQNKNQTKKSEHK